MISRVMSTQHPDNINIPFFAENHILGGDDEIQEAFYAFSHLGMNEQLWDCEGKEIDNFVVKKLLTKYPDYFHKNVLGKDKIITVRAPNPDVEKTEAKIVMETLTSFPRHYDIAKAFGQDVPPIFEVVIPMCTSEKELIRTHQYYKEFIVGEQEKKLYDIKVKDWLGEFKPEEIRVIPLFETKDAILNSAKSVEKYIQHAKVKEYQRVWFARSDPALNYGSAATVLMLKIGFQRLHELQERSGIEILPMLGCGSAPFRGHFTPLNYKDILKAYPSVQTFTAQSAFKYDYDVKDVINSVDYLNESKRGKPVFIDEKVYLPIIEKMQKEYQKCINALADTINEVSRAVPARRKRKLHIALFGYSRSMGGVQLPRAIKFGASLYSLGLPPDAFGLNVLNEKELDLIRDVYPSFDADMSASLALFNKDNLEFYPELKKTFEITKYFDFEVNQQHKNATRKIVEAIHSNQPKKTLIKEAAKIRGYLG